MKRETLTHSKRSAFQNCPRYFFHRHVEHRRLRMDKAGRRKGRAFGEALEQLRITNEALATGYPDEVQSEEDIAFLSIQQSYEGISPNNQEESDNLEFEQHALLVLVLGYAERYGLKPRREIEYLLPLVNPVSGRRSRLYDIAGKIDGLELLGHKHAEDSSLSWPVYRLIEDKLMSQIQKPMIDRLPLDQQTSEYLDAIVAKVGTVEVEVAYRFTRWPSIKQRQNETLDGFCSRFTEDLQARPDFYFVEIKVLFPTEQLEDYRRARWGVAHQIREATREFKFEDEMSHVQNKPELRTQARDRLFPQNPSRCWEYGGCEFIPLCTKRWGADDLYTTERDNPELTIDKEGDGVIDANTA